MHGETCLYIYIYIYREREREREEKKKEGGKKINWFKQKSAFHLKNPVKLPPLIKWNLLKSICNKPEKVYMCFTCLSVCLKNVLCAIYLRKISITHGS